MFTKKYDFLELLLIDYGILFLKQTAVILKSIFQLKWSKWTIENKHGSRKLSLKFIRLLRVIFSSQQRLNRPAVNAVQ